MSTIPLASVLLSVHKNYTSLFNWFWNTDLVLYQSLKSDTILKSMHIVSVGSILHFLRGPKSYGIRSLWWHLRHVQVCWYLLPVCEGSISQCSFSQEPFVCHEVLPKDMPTLCWNCFHSAINEGIEILILKCSVKDLEFKFMTSIPIQ